MIANAQLMLAITKCRVDNTSCFPTHRPLMIEISTDKLEIEVWQLQKPTNYAEMFEEKVQETYEQQEDVQNEDSTGESRDKEKAKRKRKDENEIRKELKGKLQDLMDEQEEARRHRFAYAHEARDTTMIWDLVAAAAEQANIIFHNLQGKEANKMKGRSKVCFRNSTRNMLQGIEEGEQDNHFAAKANWLRGLAQDHAAQGNRLTNIARRMKAIAGMCDEPLRTRDNQVYNQETLKAYLKQAKASGEKSNLTETQMKQISESWKQTDRKKADQPKEEEACIKEEAEKHVEEIQQHATDFNEISAQVHGCNLDNVIHAAKIKRLGDAHEARAKAIRMKLRGCV